MLLLGVVASVGAWCLASDQLVGTRSVALREVTDLPGWVDRQAVPAAEPVAVLEGDEMFLVLHGSSSCPPVPVAVRMEDAAVVVDVVTDEGPTGLCTADLASTTHVLKTPVSVGPVGPSQVVLRGRWGDQDVVLLRPDE